MKRGQTILSVVMWAAGVSIAVGGTVYNSISNKFDKVNETTVRQEGRISAVETEIKRLEPMERKLDALLIRQGINPNTLEK